jgi:hypothetical protein
MTGFWTRTRRYMAGLWLGTAVLEVVVLELARRTNNSWFLLLALAVLAIPLAAAEMTSRWFGRAPRKRWKRHDVEAGLVVASEPAVAAPVPPGPVA